MRSSLSTTLPPTEPARLRILLRQILARSFAILQSGRLVHGRTNYLACAVALIFERHHTVNAAP
jgi:hypothetical protein